MPDIRILDCTLRDGGYLNNWCFGQSNIEAITEGLTASGVDFIELGFLSDLAKCDSDSTLVPAELLLKRNIADCVSPSLLTSPCKQEENDREKFVGECLNEHTNLREGIKYTYMVNFGEVDFRLTQVPNLFEYRIAFKPYNLNDLEQYLEPIKGIEFSLNPMHISLYSEDELERLCEIANRLYPSCLTAVDTMGIMTENDVIRVFGVLDKLLAEGINLGFHSHNNLGLSLSNTKSLINMGIERVLVIDSCIGGIGRGGGILATESVMELLNSEFGIRYGVDVVRALSESVICPFKSMDTVDERFYYLSAKHRCHPNYAKYLYDKGLTSSEIDCVFERIPDEDKPYFNPDVVERLL